MGKTYTASGRLTIIERMFVGLLVIIFVGVLFHAPVSVGLSTLLPSAEVLIKAWKELLILAAGLLLLAILSRRRAWALLRDPLILLISGYAVLHLLLVPLQFSNPTAVVAGLLIDLRYVVFFGLVYLALRLFPDKRRWFLGGLVAGALVVVVFALLQVTVLPPDILAYLGYNQTTIMPFLTVDQNMDYIRINSTLRGPNPLGAFAVIVLSLVMAFWLRGNHQTVRQPMGIVSILLLGASVALWFSYSRSALVAAGVALVAILAIVFFKRVSRRVLVVAIAATLLMAGVLYVARDSSLVSNVLLHESTADQSGAVNSNQGHVQSLQEGLERFVSQPLGGGIGSTGSASIYATGSLQAIENQYLFVAHEAGWLGLGLFLLICWQVFKRLWQRRGDWLALGVFASGLGMLVIGLLLPVWVDDTVALLWWGLAAIALARAIPGGKT